MTDPIVRMEHMRALNYCARGVRAFYARHQLDYVDFLKNGTPCSVLLGVAGNDAMVLAVVEVAHGQQQ